MRSFIIRRATSLRIPLHAPPAVPRPVAGPRPVGLPEDALALIHRLKFRVADLAAVRVAAGDLMPRFTWSGTTRSTPGGKESILSPGPLNPKRRRRLPPVPQCRGRATVSGPPMLQIGGLGRLLATGCDNPITTVDRNTQ